MKFGRIILALLRRNVDKGVEKLRKAQPPHGEVKEWLNVFADPSGDPFLTYDVYQGKAPRKNILIVDIHGGAYMCSDHGANYPFCLEFAREGFDVASLDYRRNNGKIDTIDQFQDIAKGFNHLFAHLSDYGLERQPVVLTGDSAGGHFALLLAEALLNPRLAKELGVELPRIDLKAVLVNSPVYDFVPCGENALTKGARKRMFGPRYADKMLRMLLSPREHIADLAIPLFLSTCNQDFLRGEAMLLKEDFEKTGRRFGFLDIESKDPHVNHVHNVTQPWLKESKQVNQAMMDFAAEAVEIAKND